MHNTHIDVVPPAQELRRESYRASGPEGCRQLRPQEGALRKGYAFELGASCRCGSENERGEPFTRDGNGGGAHHTHAQL